MREIKVKARRWIKRGRRWERWKRGTEMNSVDRRWMKKGREINVVVKRWIRKEEDKEINMVEDE